jgi:hypothetical protein
VAAVQQFLGRNGSRESMMTTEPPNPDDWSFNTERPSSNLGVALQLAEAGLAVFPCGPDKRPLCK